MKNEVNTRSKRYYLFRHVIGSVEDSVEFRDITGSWSAVFDNAILRSTQDELADIVEASKAVVDPFAPSFTYCIGEVDIEVNGFFPIVVVHKGTP